MNNFISITILTFCINFCAPAQTKSPEKRSAIINKLQKQEKSEGKVQVIQDKRIDNLMNRLSEQNAQKMKIPGFQINIFTDTKQNAKKDVDATLAKFNLNFPGIDAYWIFDAPEWKIYVGNFRNYTDALRVRMQIKPLFPDAYIIEQLIDINKL